MNREENTFENPDFAQEWIDAIETEHGSSRENEIYPMLKNWTMRVKPEVLVEIGAGQGICSEHVEIFGKYIGIEPSETLVNRARELYTAQNKEFIVGNAYEIPLSGNSADAVFSVGVWFHLENLNNVHSELHRILKVGGEALIITSNPDMHHLWLKQFENPEVDGKRVVGKVHIPSGTLTKNIFYFHSEQEIIDSLKNNGFYVRSIVKFGFGAEDYKDEGFWMAINIFKK